MIKLREVGNSSGTVPIELEGRPIAVLRERPVTDSVKSRAYIVPRDGVLGSKNSAFLK